ALPASQPSESLYSAKNIDMNGNVLLLRFNEDASATSFADSSGSLNAGGCSGAECPRSGLIGKLGNSAKFDGTQTVVTVPDAASLRLTGNMTASAWVAWRDGDPGFGSNDYSYILEKGQNDDDNYGFLVINGTIAFEFQDTSGAYRYW